MNEMVSRGRALLAPAEFGFVDAIAHGINLQGRNDFSELIGKRYIESPYIKQFSFAINIKQAGYALIDP